MLVPPPPRSRGGNDTDADDIIGGLIPTRNPSALKAYYLAIFALIPCIGLPLAIAAFLYGLKGERFARENPSAKGRVHAWIGIVLGGLILLVYVAIILLSFGSVILEHGMPTS